jgi:hypothetical protein
MSSLSFRMILIPASLPTPTRFSIVQSAPEWGYSDGNQHNGQPIVEQEIPL